MIDPQLLEILCCPETKQPVALVEADVIDRVNAAIQARTVKNRGGKTVEEKIDGGLLREDRKYLYPIRESIPIMLEDEAIPFEELDHKS
ncbi:MAG TPA: Trm112 family protein [Vicinamibacteria bacterium]|nr:Trm112 family protein [Vicinamibacteria bacterium]